jgi:hypothetical protein
MKLYRFITDWWVQSGMPDGIEDLLIDLDSDAMDRLVLDFHRANGGYDILKFKKYLVNNGVKIVDFDQVDVNFHDKG